MNCLGCIGLQTQDSYMAILSCMLYTVALVYSMQETIAVVELWAYNKPS